MEENMHHEENEPRSYMAYRNLHDIYENVEELLHMLDEDETLAIRYDKHHEEHHEKHDDEHHHHDDKEDDDHENILISFGEWVNRKTK
jgi:hypothetical protein